MDLAEPIELHLAGIYRRRVRASLRRIWENVFDWEHLAHLHEGSFASCRLLDRGPWGWRVALGLAGERRREQIIELRADRASGRYTSTTLAGVGAGTEVRVALTPRDAHLTDVVVEFHVPEARPERLAAIGRGYVVAYARLWDEDEAMMRERERLLASPAPAADIPVATDLGDEASVRDALPLAFELAGRPFQLVDLHGRLTAHSALCPHWLGPLEGAPAADGTLRCPWHGYVFDLGTGACVGRPALSLAPAPQVEVRHGRVIAAWVGEAPGPARPAS